MFDTHLVSHAARVLARRDELTSPSFGDWKMSPAAAGLLVLAVCIYGAIFVVLSYVGIVVTKLTMIETPPPPYEGEVGDVAALDPLLKNPDEPEAEAVAVPFTRTIRSTIARLRSLEGAKALLRGVRMSILNSIVTLLFFGLFSVMTSWASGLIGSILTTTIASAAATTSAFAFSAAWTHCIIAKKSSTPLLRRLPPRKLYRPLLSATALFAVVTAVAKVFPLWGLTRVSSTGLDGGASGKDAGAAIGILATSLLLQVLVMVPAEIALTRVQASTLDAESETVVPYDRTFGKAFISVEDGGSGAISFVNAWKSVSWARIFRIIWTVVKIDLMLMGVMTASLILLGLQFAVSIQKHDTEGGSDNSLTALAAALF